MDDIEFIADYIRNVVGGTKPAGVRTYVYRDGGAEISPGNIVPLSIPEIYKPHKRVVRFENGLKANARLSGKAIVGGKVTPISSEGMTIEITPGAEVEMTFTGLRELPDKKVLEDGDVILVAKHDGVTKYSLLGRMVPNA